MKGTVALWEGFATTVPMRWVFHANQNRDDWPVIAYEFTTTNGIPNQWQHGDVVVTGEHTLDRGDAIHPNASCTPSEAGLDPHGCGAPMALVFWEIAWNLCRTSFWNCDEGETVMHGGIFDDSAPIGANLAFAYAIAHTEVGDFQSDFLRNVKTYYFLLRSFLGQSSYDRLLSVLAHHCFGESNICAGHKLPGSRLPSAHTHKEQFYEAENGYKPESVNVLSSPRSSAGAFIEIESDGRMFWDVDIPEAGSYVIKLVTRAPKRINAKIWAEVQGVGEFVGLFVVDTAWGWDDGPIFAIDPTQTGAKVLRLSTDSNTAFELDAIILEKQ